MSKRCKQCGATKAQSGRCYTCYNVWRRQRYATNAPSRAARLASGRRWRDANPERATELLKEWKRANRDRINAARRAAYAAAPRRRRERDRAAKLRARGATRPEPETCEACGAFEVRALACDHDHKTEKFRGWLCNGCNRGIGFFNDDPARLRAAADYLERNKT